MTSRQVRPSRTLCHDLEVWLSLYLFCLYQQYLCVLTYCVNHISYAKHHSENLYRIMCSVLGSANSTVLYCLRSWWNFPNPVAVGMTDPCHSPPTYNETSLERRLNAKSPVLADCFWKASSRFYYVYYTSNGRPHVLRGQFWWHLGWSFMTSFTVAINNGIVVRVRALAIFNWRDNETMEHTGNTCLVIRYSLFNIVTMWSHFTNTSDFATKWSCLSSSRLHAGVSDPLSHEHNSTTFVSISRKIMEGECVIHTP